MRRCGGEVAPSTAPVQAAADTLMVSTEEGREVPCNRLVLVMVTAWIRAVSRILHHSHPYFIYEVIMKYI